MHIFPFSTILPEGLFLSFSTCPQRYLSKDGPLMLKIEVSPEIRLPGAPGGLVFTCLLIVIINIEAISVIIFVNI